MPRCTAYTASGIYNKLRHAVDVSTMYLPASVYLQCPSCKRKVIAWSHNIICQLDIAKQHVFPCILTSIKACDLKVVRLLRERGLGNSSSKIQKKLHEGRSKGWMSKTANYLQVKYCYCGAIDRHQWAPTSQCCPDPELSSADSDIISETSEISYESADSWTNDRLPPSLIEELMLCTPISDDTTDFDQTTVLTNQTTVLTNQTTVLTNQTTELTNVGELQTTSAQSDNQPTCSKCEHLEAALKALKHLEAALKALKHLEAALKAVTSENAELHMKLDLLESKRSSSPVFKRRKVNS
ncbi:hypothetical protein MAR_029766 [Mya arenaria]|uniref:DUF6729 domain-containing protein n=1 Tax=Mya arenaria TaxID=6604 RepID=A0ABY7DJF5_MYAAR|nr:hypothetical protein MAR_029766 [Mya arenaria]